MIFLGIFVHNNKQYRKIEYSIHLKKIKARTVDKAAKIES